MNPKTEYQHPSVTHVGRGYPEKPSDTQVGGFSRMLVRLGIPTATFAVSGLIFCVAAALAASATPDPTAWVAPLSSVALGFAALVGGITAGKCDPAHPLGSAAICGCLMTLLLSALSLFGGDMGLLAWVMRITVIPVYILGGVIARPREKTASHTSHRPSHHTK